MNQDRVFSESEGDRWFERNRQAIGSSGWLIDDPPLRLLEVCGISPSHVLEVGASNGYRLNALRERHGCRAVAVEPSPAAIEDGRQRYPGVTFVRGTAGQIPIEQSGEFDLVIVNFVLHWVDRATLLRSVAEIDRMVAEGGYLLVGDFLPATAERVAYHHLPGADIWTYKQDYAALFVASALYTRVAVLTFDHAEHTVAVDVAPENRIQVALLRKSLRQGYPARTLEH